MNAVNTITNISNTDLEVVLLNADKHENGTVTAYMFKGLIQTVVTINVNKKEKSVDLEFNYLTPLESLEVCDDNPILNEFENTEAVEKTVEIFKEKLGLTLNTNESLNIHQYIHALINEVNKKWVDAKKEYKDFLIAEHEEEMKSNQEYAETVRLFLQ